MNTLAICNGIFFNDPTEDLVYIHCLISFALASIFIFCGLKPFVKSCIEDHCWWKSVAEALLVILAIALGPITVVVIIIGVIIVGIAEGITEGVREAKQEMANNQDRNEQVEGSPCR